MVSSDPSVRAATTPLRTAHDASWELIASLPLGLGVCDGEGRLLWVNAAFARAVGRPRAQVMEQRLQDLVAEPDAPGVEACLGGVVGEGHVESRQVHLVDDPSDRLGLTLRPLRETDGEAPGCWIVLDRRQALRAESSYQELFARAPVGQAIVDPEHVIVEANDAYHEILGYASGELIGRSVIELTHPEDREASRGLLSELASGDLESYEVDKRYLRADGSPVWARLAVAAVPNPAGTIAYAIGLIVDIDQRKNAELALRSAEDRLRRTLADLERRNDDLRHVAAVASHDLKGPLHSLIGFLELLDRSAEDRLTDAEVGYLERAQRGAHRMAGLIDSVLAMANSETDSLELVHVDLAALVDEVVDDLATDPVMADATVTTEDLPTVVADRGALEQVLSNLLNNAAKYASAAGIAPEIRLTSSPAGGDWVIIGVTDNGPGIPEEARESVFEMFRRLPSEARPGSGIGLAICRRLIERHGGRAWVEEAPGGGTVIAFTLPIPGGAEAPVPDVSS